MRPDPSRTETPPPVNLKKTTQQAWELLAPIRGPIIFAMFITVIGRLTTVMVPVVTKWVVDTLNYATNASNALPPAWLIAIGPVTLAAAFGLFRLIRTLFSEYRTVYFAPYMAGLSRSIATKLLGHLHMLSLDYHLNRQTGSIAADLDRGSRSLARLVNIVGFNVISTIFEIIMVAVILVWQFDWQVLAIVLVTVVIYIIITQSVTKKRLPLRTAMNEADSKARTVALDSLINHETVTNFTHESAEVERYDNRLADWQEAAVKVDRSLAFLNLGQNIVLAIGTSLLLAYTAYRVQVGALTVGDFVMLNAFILQLFIPLGFLGTVMREVQYTAADLDRLFQLFDLQPSVQEKPTAKSFHYNNGAIEFNDVHFSYDQEREILKGINFTIPAGQTLAIVGPSGSGKSTIARLLGRYYDVGSGSVIVDNQDVRDVTFNSLRRKMGVVPQDTTLFNDTIGYNIAYGRVGATDQEIADAVDGAGLRKLIDSLPDGLNTIVGERGLKLSGGEKQRVAIARVLIKNPPILILDEATSALDTTTEQHIQRELESLSENRTVLVIAHRLSTVVNANKIIVMSDGVICETGTHQSLLQEDGIYANLWQSQLESQAVLAETTS